VTRKCKGKKRPILVILSLMLLIVTSVIMLSRFRYTYTQAYIHKDGYIEVAIYKYDRLTGEKREVGWWEEDSPAFCDMPVEREPVIWKLSNEPLTTGKAFKIDCTKSVVK
jgi:hypothetical protein